MRDVERDVRVAVRQVLLEQLQRGRAVLEERAVDPLKVEAGDLRRAEPAARRVDVDDGASLVERLPDGVRLSSLSDMPSGKNVANETPTKPGWSRTRLSSAIASSARGSGRAA